LKLSDVLAAAAWPALAAAGMYACVGIARLLLTSSMPAPMLMATLIAAGGSVYAIITLATNRKGIREMADLFRKEPEDGKSI
jgi:hypothetical protein